MRVLSAQAGGEGGHSHSHSHSHSHGPSSGSSSAIDTGSEKSGLKSRSKDDTKATDATKQVAPVAEINPSLKLSAYLNLFGDFTHNITDGLAMAASFYSSPALGAVTTIATFCHEIPHEVSPVHLSSTLYRVSELTCRLPITPS